jgi:hypothetical protein
MFLFESRKFGRVNFWELGKIELKLDVIRFYVRLPNRPKAVNLYEKRRLKIVTQNTYHNSLFWGSF